MRLRTTSGALAVSAVLLVFPSAGNAAAIHAQHGSARTSGAGGAVLPGAYPVTPGAAGRAGHRLLRHDEAAMALGALRLSRHSPLSPHDEALMRVQTSIDLAAQKIRDFIKKRRLKGFTNIVVSARTKELFLYWHGHLPAVLSRLIPSLEGTAVHIGVRQAAYTEAQLARATGRIAASASARAAGMVGASPRTDGSGVDVDVETGKSKHAAAVQAALPKVGVPAFVVSGFGRPVPFSRQDDTSPFFGGAGMNPTSKSGYCTSGWPVTRKQHPSEEFLLTEEHCGNDNGNEMFKTPAGTPIGSESAADRDSLHDIALIEVASTNSGVGSEIYTGGVDLTGNYNGTGEPEAPVGSLGDPEVGDMVCVSGGASGEVCNIKITSLQYDGSPGHEHLMIGEQENHQGAAGGGDSGGPVFSYNDDLSVQAMGTIQGGDEATEVRCPSDPFRLCGWRIYMSNIQDAVNQFNIQLKTSSGNCRTFTPPSTATRAALATGPHRVCGPVLDKYLSLGGPGGFLGYPTIDTTVTPDGAGLFSHFESAGSGRADGSIYWTPVTGAHEIHGTIRDKWASMGWERSVLGYPVTDETTAPDGVGKFNHFQRLGDAGPTGSIYWTPVTGPHEIHGTIRDKWASLGWEGSVLGYPVTDETTTPDGAGRFNHFQRLSDTRPTGSIYWTPGTGAHEIHGAIRDKWASLGWERSVLGYPVTDETTTPDGAGRFNHFANNTTGAADGSIYFRPDLGAHSVYGCVRAGWAGSGWERGPFGYPTSDTAEYIQPSGAVRHRNTFEGGTIDCED